MQQYLCRYAQLARISSQQHLDLSGQLAQLYSQLTQEGIMTTRREFLTTSPGGLLIAGSAPLVPRLSLAASMSLGPPELPDGTLAASVFEALPGKLPLIKKSYQPPNFETPVNYFNEVFTPNKAFFVRYHVTNIPEVDAKGEPPCRTPIN
jgi:hypothetical protein